MILDEPAANLDPTARMELFNELIHLRKQGKTILISSHILAELERIIDEVTFIYGGKIIFSGCVSDINIGLINAFIKTTDNKIVKKFIKEKYPQYKIAGDTKTELVIKNIPEQTVNKVFKQILNMKNITVKSLRANDLQSIYDRLVMEAEIEVAREKEKSLLTVKGISSKKKHKLLNSKRSN